MDDGFADGCARIEGADPAEAFEAFTQAHAAPGVQFHPTEFGTGLGTRFFVAAARNDQVFQGNRVFFHGNVEYGIALECEFLLGVVAAEVATYDGVFPGADSFDQVMAMLVTLDTLLRFFDDNACIGHGQAGGYAVR